MVCLSSVTIVSPAKTAEPTELDLDLVGPRKHVLGEVHTGEYH